MADDKQTRGRTRRRLLPPPKLTALLLLVSVVIALAAYLLWAEPSLDLEKPSTWPVSQTRAVVVVTGLARKCPHNRFWWTIIGTDWREAGTWQQAGAGGTDFGEGGPITLAKAGTLCLRAGRDLGALQKVGLGAEDAPSSALYLAVTQRQGDCPEGTNYATPRYCLTETPLPPAPDIAP
jgi:hypothetical protein